MSPLYQTRVPPPDAKQQEKPAVQCSSLHADVFFTLYVTSKDPNERDRHCRLPEPPCPQLYRQRACRVIQSDASLRWVSVEVLTVRTVCKCGTTQLIHCSSLAAHRGSKLVLISQCAASNRALSERQLDRSENSNSDIELNVSSRVLSAFTASQHLV